MTGGRGTAAARRAAAGENPGSPPESGATLRTHAMIPYGTTVRSPQSRPPQWLSTVTVTNGGGRPRAGPHW
eukprot:405876-Hanusia_phi.AAC.1